jgi:hypothetical protein
MLVLPGGYDAEAEVVETSTVAEAEAHKSRGVTHLLQIRSLRKIGGIARMYLLGQVSSDLSEGV